MRRSPVEQLHLQQRCQLQHPCHHRWQAAPPPEPEAPVEAKIVGLVPRPAQPATLRKSRDHGLDAEIAATKVALAEGTVANLDARRRNGRNPDDPRDLYARALDIEDRIDRDDPVTPDERRWLASFQGTPEYSTWAEMVTAHGREVLNR